MSGRRATARRSSEPDGGSVGEVSAAPQFADVSRRGLAADPNTVVTPEAVLLSQPVAAVPSRLLARVIDLLLQLVIILVALVAAAFLANASETLAAYVAFGRSGGDARRARWRSACASCPARAVRSAGRNRRCVRSPAWSRSI